MIHPNGQNGGGGIGTVDDAATTETTVRTSMAEGVRAPELATRSKQRAKQQIQQNRFVIIGAGAIVAALLIFVATSMPRKSPIKKPKRDTVEAKDATAASTTTSADNSLFPITDSGRPQAKETREGFLNEHDLDRTATRKTASSTFRGSQSTAPGTLGSIPPFGGSKHGRRRHISPEQA